jgi:hypothetical protein
MPTCADDVQFVVSGVNCGFHGEKKSFRDSNIAQWASGVCRLPYDHHNHITLSVSEGTISAETHPLADAQGYIYEREGYEAGGYERSGYESGRI